MGQLDPDVKIVQEAVDDLIDLVTLHSDEGQVSHHGTLLINHRFSKVPEVHRREVYFCFESYIENLNQPRYDA